VPRAALFVIVAVAAILTRPGSAVAQPTAARFAPARLIASEPAVAPPMARNQEVWVELTLLVDEHGKVARVVVAHSGGVDFDAAAAAAAQNFLFAPATLDGKPIASEVPYRSHFLGPPPPSPPPQAETIVRVVVQPLTGEVLSKGERVPQPGVRVLVDDGAHATTTDNDGRFVIDGLSRGQHAVHFRGPDITATDENVEMRADFPTRLTKFVEVKPRYVSRVRGRSAISDPVEQTISSEEIKHIAGTQGDTLKAVQNLPGVARPPFNGGLIAVWGSPPGDTRVYADGVYIPTLYHFGGIRSTINPSIVQSLTLLPGGYAVDHGRGLGGVVELETRDPRSDGVHGFAQADLVDASGMVEGNIGRAFSFAAGFRVSWLEFIIPAFAGNSDPSRLDPKYWDYQLKLHFKASSRDTIDLFCFGSDDTLTFWVVPTEGLAHEFVQHTYFHRGVLRWQHRFADGATLLVLPSVGYDLPYQLDVNFGNATYTYANARIGWSLRAQAHVPLGRHVRLDAGLDYDGARYHLDARQNLSGLVREGDVNGDFLGYTQPSRSTAVGSDHMILYNNSVAPFVAMTVTLWKQRLSVMPQLRVETMSFYGYPLLPKHFTSTFVLPEPRLAARLRITSRVAVYASLGWYHQAPDAADFSTVFGNPTLRPESAIHYVTGVETRATATLHVELQAFYKDLRDLVVRGALPTDPPLEGGGIGRVYGAELLVRQELWRNFFGWISYTLMRSERQDHSGDPWRPFQYDQTHILTVLGSYKLPYGFQVGLRFRYATGNPYTPVVRAYYDVNSASFVPLYGPPNSGRLPPFNQLDLRVDKTFAFNYWKMVLYLDLQNVYDATSVEGVTYSYDYRTPHYLNGLPILPVFGARGEF
jgi:TonB family protein